MRKRDRAREQPSQPDLSEWQKQILEERIAAEDSEPDEGSPWEDVKRRILASL